MDAIEDSAAKELFSDKLSRTIQILNVHEDLTDEIELYVESRRHGGGEFENCEYDRKHLCLTVTFVDAKGLRNLSLFYLFLIVPKIV